MKLFPEILLAGFVSGVVTAVDQTGTPENVTGIIGSVAMLGEKFGVLFIILVYFLGRDYLRSRADAKERADMWELYNEKDRYIREELTETLAAAVKEIHKNKAVNSVLIETLKDHPETRDGIRQFLDDLHSEQDDSGQHKVRKH